MNRNAKPLYEQFRPQSWADVVGQDKAVSSVLRLRDRSGLAGRAFWITGASGTGKTTIGRLIAAEVADEMNVEELDASELTAQRLREIERQSQSLRFGARTGVAYIINEAHALRRDCIRQLLVTLERIPAHVVWVFTNTTEGSGEVFEDSADGPALLSRCIRLDLSRRGLAEPFAERARTIAQAEGLDGKPIENYIRLAQTHRNNFRAMLSAIEAGVMAD